MTMDWRRRQADAQLPGHACNQSLNFCCSRFAGRAEGKARCHGNLHGGKGHANFSQSLIQTGMVASTVFRYDFCALLPRQGA